MTLGIDVVVDTGPEGAKAEIEIFGVDENGVEIPGSAVKTEVDQGKISDRIYLHATNGFRVKEIMPEPEDNLPESEPTEDEPHDEAEAADEPSSDR